MREVGVERDCDFFWWKGGEVRLKGLGREKMGRGIFFFLMENLVKGLFSRNVLFMSYGLIHYGWRLVLLLHISVRTNLLDIPPKSGQAALSSRPIPCPPSRVPRKAILPASNRFPDPPQSTQGPKPKRPSAPRALRRRPVRVRMHLDLVPDAG